MNKPKMKRFIEDADRFAKEIEDQFPKARNRVGSLRWILKSAKEELEKPDEVVAPVVPVLAPEQLRVE